MWTALVVAGACLLLVALYAERVAAALTRFWSGYPLVRLSGERQLRLRPAFVRAGALVLLAGLCASFAARATPEKYSLERFPASSLRVIGISEPDCDGRRSATVRDPDRYIHHVEVGDHIGDAYGKVGAITANEVSFVELYIQADGQWKEVPAVLSYTRNMAPEAGQRDCCKDGEKAMPEPAPAKQTQSGIERLAQKYVAKKRLGDASFRARTPSFDAQSRTWHVHYQSDAGEHALGTDHFGLAISDDDPDEIDLQRGR